MHVLILMNLIPKSNESVPHGEQREIQELQRTGENEFTGKVVIVSNFLMKLKVLNLRLAETSKVNLNYSNSLHNSWNDAVWHILRYACGSD